MKKINSNEMRSVNGGATYKKKCSKCGWTYMKSYSTWLGYLWAKHVVDSAVRDCKH